MRCARGRGCLPAAEVAAAEVTAALSDRDEAVDGGHAAWRKIENGELGVRLGAPVLALDSGLGRVCPRSLHLRVRIACNARRSGPGVVVWLMILLSG